MKTYAGAIQRCEDQAHAAGRGCAQKARAAIYGTRYTNEVDAGTAPARGSFGGGAPRSVWQGPKQIRSGAPVLRRDRGA